jgi:hypothetical protein
MLRITTRQLATFRRTALTAFEEQMVEHCAAFSPRLSAALGRRRLSEIVHAAMDRAAGHGLTFKGPVRLFIELGFLFGSGFDADVQYPWAAACLGDDPTADQMDRAAALHEASVDALSAFRGPDGRNLRGVLRRAQALLADPPPLDAGALSDVAFSALERVHPAKCAHVGEPALRALIAAGASEGPRHGLSGPRDVLLLVALMFAFGQGCAADPIHPWIGQALRDHDLEARALTALRDAIRELGR